MDYMQLQKPWDPSQAGGVMQPGQTPGINPAGQYGGINPGAGGGYQSPDFNPGGMPNGGQAPNIDIRASGVGGGMSRADTDTMQQLRTQQPGQSGQYGGINPGGMDSTQQSGQIPVQGGYSPEEFGQWYQSQFQSAPGQGLIGRLQATVGAPQGPNGTYSQQQWQQAQQIAQQDNPGFFPEFNAPQYQQGPEMGGYQQGPEFNQGASYQNAPMYQTPEAFNYEGFQAPTAEQAAQDPGYQFALQQGTQAIMGNKAAAGLARTGGTLKELMNYGQKAGANQYGDVYNRAAQSYGMNRSNAADNYATNYQIGRTAWTDRESAQQSAYDRNQSASQWAQERNQSARENAYQLNQGAWDRNQAAREGAHDRNYRGASDSYNARFAGRQAEFDDLYRRWATRVNVETQRELGR